ncbi:MAG: sulfite exporter TauE/SafE family protein [Solirubrobacteraceae bacterium]
MLRPLGLPATDAVHIDPYIVLGSAIVGLLVGMTGAGGGALMTPMLILLFGVKPTTAISSDLVAAVLMRPVGAAVHLRAGTVNLRIVRWMVLGSVPAAFFGAYLLHLLGHAKSAQHHIETVLGIALLIGAAAMALRFLLDRRSGNARTARIGELRERPLPTVAIGVVGGIIVGMTSVGSGSLMIVLLLFLYPMIGANQLVGTDLTQAVPLTLSAALGALLFGHVQFGLTASLIIGSVPAVLVGSLLSSTVPDRYVRPTIAFVIFASGLKYAGLGTTELGWTLCGVLLVAAAAWLLHARPGLRQGTSGAVADVVIDPLEDELVGDRES